MKTATVALINPDNKLLILCRGNTAPWMPNRYCLPGGHVEPNEDVQYCAVRELSEETGVSYPVDNLREIKVHYGGGYVKSVWLAHTDYVKILLNWEHSDYQWVSSEESTYYPLVPGLRTTIKTLSDSGHLI